jgi:hypothetical protein
VAKYYVDYDGKLKPYENTTKSTTKSTTKKKKKNSYYVDYDGKLKNKQMKILAP